MQFLINTFTHWEEPPRARHQVAYALAKNYRVVFVAANKVGFPKIRPSTIHGNLKVLTPYFPVGNKIRYRLPIINELYQYWLFRKLVKTYRDYEVINFDYTATLIYRFFTQVIYYCNDSFSAISNHINPSFIAIYHRKCEAKVAAKAKFCVAVSTILKDNLKKYNPNAIEIPLGSPDIREFNLTINPVSNENKILNVGLVGFMNIHIISTYILNLLLKDENIRLTFVGPVEEKFLNFIENKGKMILKGPLTGKDLYEEINKFDVTIAPYCSRLSKETHSGVGTGSKIYHYFALGKPVVITYMAGLEKINLPEKFIYIANSEEEFSPLIHVAYKENTENLAKQRINYANGNTWEKRMEILIDYYKKT